MNAVLPSRGTPELFLIVVALTPPRVRPFLRGPLSDCHPRVPDNPS